MKMSPFKCPPIFGMCARDQLRRLPPLLLRSALLFGAANPVFSQSADGALEEVVVTAQKRTENVQNVPIAITAFSAKDIDNHGLTDVVQLAAFAPNVVFDNTSAFAASSQVFSATIRGIGQDDFAFNLEPGVGVYIDGVYYARALGAVVDLLDLDHVEILKGPQGTLFGRNTIGGAVSVVTRRPSDDFGFTTEVTTGSFNRLNFRGTVDVPLIEGSLLAQLSVSSKEADGYATRLTYPGSLSYQNDEGRFIASGLPGGSTKQGGENQQNVRGKILWSISDSAELLLQGDYTRVNQEARPWTLLATNAGPTAGTVMSIYNACIGLPPAVLSGIGLGPICGPRATVGTALAGANVSGNPAEYRLPFGNQYITGNVDTNYGVGSNFDVLNAWGGSATLDWTLLGDMKLKSITAVRGLDSRFGDDIVGAPFVVNDVSIAMGQHQESEELQLTSTAFDHRLKNLLGLYYFRETGDMYDTPTFGEGLIQIYGPNFFRNSAYAAFVHEQFAITDRLTATVGDRLTREDKQFTGEQAELNEFNIKLGLSPSVFPDPNDLTRLYPLGVNRRTFTNSSPKLGLDYRFTDDVMGYLSYSKGFKSGGWSTRLLAPAPGNIAPTFGPETASTYEAGLKSELLDRRLRLNAAAFYTKYDGLQVLVYDGISPVFQNAGTAVIKGAELESQARVVSNLFFTANVGYLDAYYTRLDPGSLLTLSDKLANTPKWSADVGPSYRQDLPNKLSLTLQADFSHKSNMARDSLNSPYLFSGNVDLLNASVKLASDDNRWEVALGGRNLTDKRYIIAGYDQMAAGQVGDVTATYTRPREWYLTFRVHR
jgi:iron complex outermembrane recepter protein